MKQMLHSLVCKCLFATLLGFICQPSFSQYSESTSFWEAGITAGPSNFLGDLGGHYGRGTAFLKDNNIQMTKFMFGGFLSYHPNEWLGFRLAGNIGSLEGDDAIINGKGGLEEFRKLRNANFKSKLAEAFLLAEFYPTVFFEYEPDDIYHKLRPYGVLGVGVFHFNPMGTDPAGNWHALKPLHTEGQGFPEYPERKEYKLTQINIPMGVGLKYFASDNVNISLEVIHRKTFSDYIDDVSTTYIDPALFYAHLPFAQAQLAESVANKSGGTGTRYTPGNKRGTPTHNDGYYSVGFKLGFRLASGTDRRWRNSTRCPVHY